jgi:Tfp pilus assembly protein PilN
MIDINLIAVRRAQRQRVLALMRLSFYSLFGLALLIVLLYAWLTVQIRFVEGGISEAEAVLSAPEMQENLRRIQFLKGEIRVLSPKAEVLQRVHESETRWIEVLRDIGTSAPAYVWVESVQSRMVDNGQRITLSGSAESQRLIGAYMLAVQGKEWCGPLQLIQANTMQDRTGRKVVAFEVTVPLQEPIGIDLLGPEAEEPAAAAAQPAKEGLDEGGLE